MNFSSMHICEAKNHLPFKTMQIGQLIMGPMLVQTLQSVTFERIYAPAPPKLRISCGVSVNPEYVYWPTPRTEFLTRF